MARPPKEGIDYFPHDCDASHDEKIESLCAIYGHHVGYSVIFRLYERIYRAGGKLIVSDAETMQILAKNVADMPVDKLLILLDSCFRLGIFDKKLFKGSKILTSNGIIKRMDPIISKRIKMKEIYEKSQKNKEVSGTISKAETPPETPQSKGKESKVKERTNYKPAFEIDKNIEKKLGAIATLGLIKAVLRETPEQMWWKIDKYLKKRYPEGGNGFEKATKELRDEKNTA